MVNTEAEEIAAVIQHLQGGVVIFFTVIGTTPRAWGAGLSNFGPA